MLKSRKTGDVVLDMLIAIAVPFVVQGLAAEWERIKPHLTEVMNRLGFRVANKDKYSRTIGEEKVKVVVKDYIIKSWQRATLCIWFEDLSNGLTT